MNQEHIKLVCYALPLQGDGVALQPLVVVESYEAPQLRATPNPTVPIEPTNPWAGPRSNKPKRRWLRRRK